MKEKINPFNLAIFILLCEMAGLIGSIFTIPATGTWYAELNKPSFSPPNWVFGPVWVALYALMGISACLVFSKGWKNKKIKNAIKTFSLQLILNVLWSIIFFGGKNPFLALVEIIILWTAIFVTIKKFNEISKTAGNLLIPYLAWVSFAAILNLSIVLMN
ncbi:MAG: tryptophan-rich sensory protein [Candidatus Aenigmarchaeota archaeon]|nr:tryptophan-rich sensory protein [Candidatus Aenigmarchaeota archaeon]